MQINLDGNGNTIFVKIDRIIRGGADNIPKEGVTLKDINTGRFM